MTQTRTAAADRLAAVDLLPAASATATLRVRAAAYNPDTAARVRCDVAPDTNYTRTPPRNVRPTMTARARANIYVR